MLICAALFPKLYPPMRLHGVVLGKDTRTTLLFIYLFVCLYVCIYLFIYYILAWVRDYREPA
jgi:hypothetical protein